MESSRPKWVLRRVDVQRDMDLVRRILLHVRERKSLDLEAVAFDGVDSQILGRHIEMLYDLGFLEGMASEPEMDDDFKPVLVRDLSWHGHDFAEAIANKTVWDRVKTGLTKSGLAGLPLSVIKDLSVATAKSLAFSALGLKE